MSKQKKVSRRVLTDPKIPAPIIGGVVTPRASMQKRITASYERAAVDRIRGRTPKKENEE